MELNKYEQLRATLRVLIMGISGTGKSTLAATLSKHFNVTWVDNEDAIDVLGNLPPAQKARIRVIKIPDTAAFPIAAQTIQALFKAKKANICDEHGVISCPPCTKESKSFELIDFAAMNHKEDVLVLDSLTQMGISLLNNICRNKAIDYKPERDDWGGLKRNTEFLAANIQGCGINLVCTALPVEVKLEDGREKMVPQFGSQAMSQVIGAKFGTIIYTDVKNKKHIAFSSSTESNMVLTKSRVGFKIEDLPEPDLCPMFLDYIKNHSGELQPQTNSELANQEIKVAQVAQQNAKAVSLLSSIKK